MDPQAYDEWAVDYYADVTEYVFHTGDPRHWTTLRLPKGHLVELHNYGQVPFCAAGEEFMLDHFFETIGSAFVWDLVWKNSPHLLPYIARLWGWWHQKCHVIYMPVTKSFPLSYP